MNPIDQYRKQKEEALQAFHSNGCNFGKLNDKLITYFSRLSTLDQEHIDKEHSAYLSTIIDLTPLEQVTFPDSLDEKIRKMISKQCTKSHKS